MTEPSRRKRLQFHLSTALMLTIASGVLLWVNLVPRLVKDPKHTTFFNWFEGPTCFISGRAHGWPLAAVLNYEAGPVAIDPFDVSRWRVSFDALFALILLASVWFVCEWWILRRARLPGRMPR